VQFKNRDTKNYQKAKKISRTKRCIICHSRLRMSGVFILDPIVDDVKAVRCINCLTMYSTDFEIEDLGIPQEVGAA